MIASIAGEASQIGIIALINLMAILSVNLGIINILPFPGLDGGHALIAIIEGIIGRRIPFKNLNDYSANWNLIINNILFL